MLLYIETGIVYFKPIRGIFFLFFVYSISFYFTSSPLFFALIGNDDANT
jgi:hypothetical protein